jgi:ABC-type uncharacterized transport system permease subunit
MDTIGICIGGAVGTILSALVVLITQASVSDAIVIGFILSLSCSVTCGIIVEFMRGYK